MINAFTGGYDYFNGAKGWDGTDVLQGSPNPNSLTEHNSPENFYRQKNGGISDPIGLAPAFYTACQKFIGQIFGIGGREYRTVQPMILNKTVVGKVLYVITAIHDPTVFYDH